MEERITGTIMNVSHRRHWQTLMRSRTEQPQSKEETTSRRFGLHASQTNGNTVALLPLGSTGSSETSTQHEPSKTLSLSPCCHQRPCQACQEDGTLTFSMVNKQRKPGRDWQPLCCCCCCVSWLLPPPPPALVSEPSRGTRARLSLWKWESPGTESAEAQKASRALFGERRSFPQEIYCKKNMINAEDSETRLTVWGSMTSPTRYMSNNKFTSKVIRSKFFSKVLLLIDFYMLLLYESF